MSFLNGVLGGVVGAGMVSVIGNVLEKHGGLQGVVDQFEKQGLGPTVKSWIGTGPNQPVTGDQVHAALGADTVKDLAAKAGMTVQDLLQKLAQHLPQAVDKLTPDGQLPKPT